MQVSFNSRNSSNMSATFLLTLLLNVVLLLDTEATPRAPELVAAGTAASSTAMPRDSRSLSDPESSRALDATSDIKAAASVDAEQAEFRATAARSALASNLRLKRLLPEALFPMCSVTW